MTVAKLAEEIERQVIAKLDSMPEEEASGCYSLAQLESGPNAFAS